MGGVHKLGWSLARRLADRMSSHHTKRMAILFAEKARPMRELHDYECPLCGYQGRFSPIFGAEAIRFDGECPQCHSRERHRFLKLWMDAAPRCQSFGRFLHFAPEPILTKELQGKCQSYKTADIEAGRADLVLDIQQIDLPDESIDTIMANHVLEHVDDRKALREMYRVLKPGGFAILTVPIVEGWSETYEDPTKRGPGLQFLHFGQDDHIRILGHDFERHIAEAGFRLETHSTTGADCARHGLTRGEKIYVALRE